MGQIITVDFHDSKLLTFERDGAVLVAVRSIAEGMGIDWSSQLQRIKRDGILSEAVVMVTTPFSRHGQEEVCLPLDLVHGWLFTIDDSRVKDEETRQRVLVYKRECYRVLFEHFHPQHHVEHVETAELLQPPHAEQRPFPDWTLEELRTKGQTVDRYRITLGLPAAQWIMPQLGFPMPPPELVNRSRQLEIFAHHLGSDPDEMGEAA